MSSVNRPLYERINDAISLCFLAAVVSLYFLKVSDVQLYFEHTQLLRATLGINTAQRSHVICERGQLTAWTISRATTHRSLEM